MSENLEQTSPTLEHIEQLAEQLSVADKLALVEHLARKLRRAEFEKGAPQSLRGAWKGKFPEGIDLDKEIAEIRGEWLKELDEMETEMQAEKR